MGGRGGGSGGGGGGAGGSSFTDAQEVEIPMPNNLPDQLQYPGKGRIIYESQEGINGARRVSVDPNELINTQPSISMPYMGNPNSRSRENMPVVAVIGGKKYLLDGHHRKHEAIRKGIKLPVLIVHL